MPDIAFQVPHARARLWPNLGGETVRICFVNLVVVEARLYVIFVNCSLSDAGHKSFPDAGGARKHRAGCRIPVVEIPYDGDELRIRSPYRELHSPTALAIHDMSAQLLVGPVVGTFGEQVPVELGQSILHGARSSRVPMSCPFARAKRSSRNRAPFGPYAAREECAREDCLVSVPQSSAHRATSKFLLPASRGLEMPVRRPVPEMPDRDPPIPIACRCSPDLQRR